MPHELTVFLLGYGIGLLTGCWIGFVLWRKTYVRVDRR